MTHHLFEIPRIHLRVAFVFAWYDMWVGAYVKTPSQDGMREVYVMCFMVGLLFSGREPWERGIADDYPGQHEGPWT